EMEAASEGPRYAETAVKSRELRASLAPQVAVVTVEVEVTGGDLAAATVLLAGAEHTRAWWGRPFAVQPGNVEIVGRYHGAPRARQTVAAARGAAQTVKLAVGPATSEEPLAPPPVAATPPPEPDEGGGSLIPLVAVSAGLGAGGLAVFTVF